MRAVASPPPGPGEGQPPATVTALASTWASHRYFLISCLSVLSGLCLWQLLATQVSDRGLALPTDVIGKLFNPAFQCRLMTALGGFMSVLAVPVGILIGRSKILAQTFEPLIIAIYALPPVAFVLLPVLWLGLFFEARVSLVVLMTVFDITTAVIAGARDIRPGLIEVGRSFDA